MNIEDFFEQNGNIDIIRCTNNIKFTTILDIGFGKGGASLFFAKAGKKVTSIGKNTASYKYPRDEFKKYGIDVHDCTIEEFSADKKFDAIWCSHMLEHCCNISLTLQKIRDLLKDDGWLFITVPPHKSNVVTGHISVGWNLVQLMLTLFFNGYNVKDGHFCSHKYNISAFVKKEKNPRYRPEEAGWTSLNTLKPFFPIDIHQGMEGDIESVNWFCNVDHQKIMIQKKYFMQLKNIILDAAKKSNINI